MYPGALRGEEGREERRKIDRGFYRAIGETLELSGEALRYYEGRSAFKFDYTEYDGKRYISLNGGQQDITGYTETEIEGVKKVRAIQFAKHMREFEEGKRAEAEMAARIREQEAEFERRIQEAQRTRRRRK